MVAGAMRVVLVLKESGDDAKFFVQKVVVDMENPSGKASQRLELELPKTPLSFPFSPSPISFTYSVDTQELHVLDQSGDLCIFPTSSILNGQITPRISIDISQVKLALNSSLFSGLYGSSCLAPIESSYVAIVGPRYRGKYIEEVLTLWDIKYGTLQAERILNTKDPELASTDVLSTIESKASNGRVFDIRVTTSTALGPTLVVSISDIEEVQPITFSSFTHLIPYYSTEITLLSALGKMQGTAFSVDNINDAELKISKDSKGLVSIANINGDDEPHLWLSNLLDMEKFDRDTIMNLLNPTATKTAADFEAALLQWLVKKTSNDATSFATLPFVEIAQPVMQAFLLRILAKPSAFWPSQALRYLIRTGRATAHVDPLNRESASSNLIRAVLDRDDLETLAAVLEPGMVPDLSEMDLVSILKYVCATQADGEAKSALQLQRRVVAMDKAVKAMMPKPAKDPKSKSTVEEVVVGRNWYFEKIFTMPKNDIHMSRAMKVLRVEDLEILVEWAKSLVVKDERETLYHLNKKAEVEELQREERKPLWWLWPAENAHALHYDMALDVLTLIIDSNLSAVLLSASLQERFEGLAEVLNVDMKVMSLLERRLKESLVPFNAPPKKQKKKVEGADKEDQHRQRWKRMVADVHDGVGKYSMEVFKI
ncbi:hypothetical protein BC829DRAFT_127863 [Chytridium lagenaria]|nr:hypothetical protein BC829DRAFT_127863 [Chytridium lagenaria]